MTVDDNVWMIDIRSNADGSQDARSPCPDPDCPGLEWHRDARGDVWRPSGCGHATRTGGCRAETVRRLMAEQTRRRAQPSDRAIEHAVTAAVRANTNVIRDEVTQVAAAMHDPILGLNMSVRLGDVVDLLRTRGWAEDDEYIALVTEYFLGRKDS